MFERSWERRLLYGQRDMWLDEYHVIRVVEPTFHLSGEKEGNEELSPKSELISYHETEVSILGFYIWPLGRCTLSTFQPIYYNIVLICYGVDTKCQMKEVPESSCCCFLIWERKIVISSPRTQNFVFHKTFILK